MPQYRRWFQPGGSFFFTVVTDRRAPIFAAEHAVRRLGDCVRAEQHRRPFALHGVVVLPDHLHAIWTLPDGDARFDARWTAIKATFTRGFLRAGGAENEVSPGRANEGRRGVWQPRYFEHLLRDEADFQTHLDYLHYNPVKHGHARCPKDWPWSSFARHVRLGTYPPNWGCLDAAPPPVFVGIDENLAD